METRFPLIATEWIGERKREKNEPETRWNEQDNREKVNVSCCLRGLWVSTCNIATIVRRERGPKKKYACKYSRQSICTGKFYGFTACPIYNILQFVRKIDMNFSEWNFFIDLSRWRWWKKTHSKHFSSSFNRFILYFERCWSVVSGSVIFGSFIHKSRILFRNARKVVIFFPIEDEYS